MKQRSHRRIQRYDKICREVLLMTLQEDNKMLVSVNVLIKYNEYLMAFLLNLDLITSSSYFLPYLWIRHRGHALQLKNEEKLNAVRYFGAVNK